MNYSNEQTNKTSLLILNNNCLIKIFQFLPLDNLLNLHKTCHRLRDVVYSVCALKYKEIVIIVENNKKSNKLFLDILTVIGQHVSTMEIYDPNEFVLQTIREKCNNIKTVNLWCYNGRLQLPDPKNLKGLKVTGVWIDTTMSFRELKNCFESIPDLESLEWDGLYEPSLIKLLKMLPKLQSLRFRNLPPFLHLNQEFQDLLSLNGLTKLSFRSDEKCDLILLEVAKKLKLAELDISMPFDEDSVRILKSFQNLEYLSITQWRDELMESWFSDATVFPSKLKRIKIANPKISSNTFLSIVDRLQFLKEFDVGFGDIFWDDDRCKSLF